MEKLREDFSVHTNQNVLEFVVLVDEQDREIGTMLKSLVHHHSTPLHRAFSLYLFNSRGEVLIQQRKKEKITWGGFWSNSCCGHPRPEENREEAAKRRAKEELGIETRDIEKMADYRYRFEYNNVAENEICPIFTGSTEESIRPNWKEIEEFRWLAWPVFLQDIKNNASLYSPWCKEQVQILSRNQRFPNG